MTKPGTSEGWAESVFKKAIASELEREGWDLSKIEDDVRLFDGVCIVCFSQKRQEGSAAYVPCLLDKELFLGVIDLHTRDIIISQTPKEKAAVRSPGMFSRIRRKLLGAGLGLAMAVSLAGCPHGETPIAPVVVEDGVVSEADLEEDLVADETSAGPVFITDEQGNTVFTLPEGVFEHIFYPEQSYADRSGFAAFRFVETGTNLVEECYADADMSILLMRVEYDRAGNVKGYHWFTSEGDSLVEMIYDGYGTLTRQIFYDTGYNPSEIYNFGGFGRLESYEYNFTSSQSGFIFPKIIEVYESGRLTETREYGTNGLLAVVKKHNKYNSEKIEFYHFFDEYYENGQPVVERVYFSLNRSYLAREIFYDVSGEVTVKNTHNSLSGDRSFKYDYGQEGECVSIECTDGE
ncbi:MAG TPA: hypothetical protein PKZ41_05845, partial [Candidatus Omnitrophota bacterium]|nr:hypothetical protein [Candidatus Omnitrophota bacterium]